MEQIGNSATSRDVSDLHRKEEFVGDIARKESTQTTLNHHFNKMLMSLLPFHRANRLIMKMRLSLIVGFGGLLIFQDVLHQIMQLGHCLFLISMIRNQVMMVHSTSKRRGSRPLLVARCVCLKKTMRASTNKMLF